jgi:anti-sigma factor RsiW
MNCVELQHSLTEIDDAASTEQQAHLRTCPACSALVAELNLIVSSAPQLREADEPSPRVWNSIEIVLRQEGLIHPPQSGRSLIPSFGTPWGWARWIAPVAAALLITLGVYMRQHAASPELANNAKPAPISDAMQAGLNDDDFLQEVSDQTPGIKTEYQDNLRRVNEYIQDARNDVEANPNDQDARRSLMEAYEQKAMLFEMAMDRSLQ